MVKAAVSDTYHVFCIDSLSVENNIGDFIVVKSIAKTIVNQVTVFCRFRSNKIIVERTLISRGQARGRGNANCCICYVV